MLDVHQPKIKKSSMRIKTAELEFTNFPFNRFIPDENLIDGDVVKSSAIDKLL